MLNLNDLGRSILQSKGVTVTCPNCKQKFLAKSDPAQCTHCYKSFDVNFNVR